MSSNEKKLPSILESFVIAFSMYSRIPMPFVECRADYTLRYCNYSLLQLLNWYSDLSSVS